MKSKFALGLYVNWYNGNTGIGTGIATGQSSEYASYVIQAGEVQSLATITAKLEDTQWSSNS